MFHDGFTSTFLSRGQHVHLRVGKDEVALDQIGLDWIGLDGIGLHWMGLRVHSHLKIVGFVLEKEQECRSKHVSCNPVQ